MKAVINGIEVEGTPEEIAKFRRELEADRSREEKEPPKGCYNDCYDKNGNWLGDI